VSVTAESDVSSPPGLSRLGLGAVVGLVAASALAAGVASGVGGTTRRPELWKVVGVGWVAFAAMGLAIPLGARAATRTQPTALVWGYGLASGAMVASAAAFLLPQAIGLHPRFGGFGVAFGVVAGFGAHSIGHRLTHADLPFDHTALELSAHALSAGVIIGLVYGNMPDLGILLGLAIVSHKGPAGYAAARRLATGDKPPSVLLLPAAGVGLAAIPAALIELPAGAALRAVVFGFAAGVFLHVAMDFLPSCEVGGEVYEVADVSEGAHHTLDRLRLHAVASTVLGGLAVFVAWVAVA
jgi:ZIP family zinc transporter